MEGNIIKNSKIIDSSHFLISAQIGRSQLPENEYYSNIPALANGVSVDFHPGVTFFVGENGTGKSTLLEALAIGMGLNPEGGSHNFNFSSKETHSSLHKQIELVKGVKRYKDAFFLRAESFYNVASMIDALSEGDKSTSFMQQFGNRSLHSVSHGESFLALITHRLRPGGLYFFDEPEAALSPQGQMSFLVKLSELVTQGAQCIITTHSPIIMAYPQADILEFTDKIEKVDYESVRHVQLMKDFIENREVMLSRLLH